MRREFDVLDDPLDDQVRRLGLRPIAGGSDDDPDDTTSGGGGDDTVAGTGGDDTAAGGAAGDDDDPAAENARLREENARLAGELSGLRTQPRHAEPAQRRVETMTLAQVDENADTLTADELATAASSIAKKIDDSEIAAGYGARLLGRLEAVRFARQRDARDAATRPIRNAETKLAAHLEKYPELKRAGSELHGKVMAELATVADEFGFDRGDPRAQVIAVERVVGGHHLGGGMNGREIARRRTPTGGVGAGAGGDGGGGGTKDPVKEVERLYPDQMTYWRRMGYSADDMKAEAPLVLQRRAAGRRRTA